MGLEEHKLSEFLSSRVPLASAGSAAAFAVAYPTQAAPKPLPDALPSQEGREVALESPSAGSSLALDRGFWRSVSLQQVAQTALRIGTHHPYKRRDSPCGGFSVQYTLPWGTN